MNRKALVLGAVAFVVLIVLQVLLDGAAWYWWALAIVFLLVVGPIWWVYLERAERGK